MENQPSPIENSSAYIGIIVAFFKEKFLANFLLLWTYLKTTAYVFAKPAILIDDEEDEGLFDHVGYSMGTFTVIALVFVGLALVGFRHKTSRDTLQLENGVCISGDCENGFGVYESPEFSYEGFYEKGLPHGIGVLKTDTTKVVSKFLLGHFTGTGFASTEISRDFHAELEAGDRVDDISKHYFPILSVFAFLLSLLIYIKIFGFFKGIYREMPDSYITKAAIFHFNFMFFLFTICITALMMGDSTFSEVIFFVLFFVFVFHPFYFFFRLGKIKLSPWGVMGFLILTGVSYFYNFLNVMALAFFLDLPIMDGQILQSF